MKFKEWLKLQETGTFTGDVAVFARPCMPIVRREKKKKKEGHKQVSA